MLNLSFHLNRCANFVLVHLLSQSVWANLYSAMIAGSAFLFSFQTDFCFDLFLTNEICFCVCLVVLLKSKATEELSGAQFSNRDCHLRSLPQSVECSLVVLDLGQVMQTRIKTAALHQHQPNNHSNVLQHVTTSTTSRPSSMFWPNLCGFVNSIFDDNWRENWEKNEQTH